jgi:hypothetical protein
VGIGLTFVGRKLLNRRMEAAADKTALPGMKPLTQEAS